MRSQFDHECVLNAFSVRSQCSHWAVSASKSLSLRSQYALNMVATSTIRSCSSLCAAMETVLRPYIALVRAQTLCACFVHTQNKRRVSALKVAHGDPPPFLTVSTTSPTRSQRPHCASPHAFILFRSQWECSGSATLV